MHAWTLVRAALSAAKHPSPAQAKPTPEQVHFVVHKYIATCSHAEFIREVLPVTGRWSFERKKQGTMLAGGVHHVQALAVLPPAW